MDGDKEILEIRKAPTEEEIFELEKKYMVGGELRDLLLLTGIIGDEEGWRIDWEKRAKIFEAEIMRLNEVIEKLGGQKEPYCK